MPESARRAARAFVSGIHESDYDAIAQAIWEGRLDWRDYWDEKPPNGTLSVAFDLLTGGAG